MNINKLKKYICAIALLLGLTNLYGVTFDNITVSNIEGIDVYFTNNNSLIAMPVELIGNSFSKPDAGNNDNNNNNSTKDERDKEKEEELKRLYKEVCEKIKELDENVEQWKSDGIKAPYTAIEYLKQLAKIENENGLKHNEGLLYYNHPELIEPRACGDPVLIATGKYFHECADFDFNCGAFNFKINRNYVSDFDSGVAFGKEWKTFFDSKIIRGKSNAIIRNYEQAIRYYESNRNCTDHYGIYKDKVDNALKKVKEYADSIYVDYTLSVAANNYNKYSTILKYSYMNDSTGLYILYVDENGDSIIFEKEKSNYIFTPVVSTLKNKMKLSFINNDINSGFVIRYYDGSEKRFSKWGFLESIKDTYGNTIKFFYGNNPSQINKIYFEDTLLYEVEWKNNKIAAIKDCRNGDVLNYFYKNDKLNLVQKNNENLYEYDFKNELLKSILNNGLKTSINYKNVSGSNYVTSVESNNRYEKFDYNLVNKSLVYINADGEQTFYKFNENNLITEQRNPDKSYILRSYDENGNLKKLENNYEKINFYYNQYGNLIKSESDTGACESWVYSNKGELVSYVDADGVKTEYSYDKNGNLILIKKSGTVVYSAEYENGKLLECSGIGIFDNYSYDEKGNMKSNLKMKYEYDSKNRISISYDHLGNKSVYEWSDDESELKITTNAAFVKQINFTKKGSIESIYETNLKTKDVHVKLYEYDAHEQLKKIEVGEGKKLEEALSNLFILESYEYYPSGRLKTAFSYNHGIAIKNDGFAIRYDFKYSGDNVIYQSVSFVDESLNPIGEIFKEDISYSFENKLLLKTRKSFDGFTKKIWLNKNQNVVKLQNGNSLTYENYLYSPAGNLKSYKNIYGGKINYLYDPVSSQVSQIIKNGKVIQEYEYDNLGQLTKSIAADGTSVKYAYAITKTGTSVFEYNGDTTCVINYDMGGNVNSISYLEDKKQKFSLRYDRSDSSSIYKIINKQSCVSKYDAWNRLIYDASNDLHLEYDVFGNVSKAWRYEENNFISYEYNSKGQLSRQVNSSGVVNDFSYDVFGNLISKKENGIVLWTGKYDSRKNLIEEESSGYGKTKYCYDNENRLTAIYQNNVLQMSNVFSDNNKHVIRKDANGNVWHSYLDDFGDNYKTVNPMGDDKNVIYDPSKSLIKIKDFNGENISYYTDTRNSALKVSSSDGLDFEISYNYLGSISKINSNYNGRKNKADYSYGLSNELIQQNFLFGNNKNFKSEYSYDEKYNRSSLRFSNYKLEYKTNKMGLISQINASKGSSDCSLKFEYDDFGRQIKRIDSDGTSVESEYDSNSRLHYRCHKNSSGKIISSSLYVYDYAGRISYEINADGTYAHYEYDDFGRVSKFVLPLSKEIIDEKKSDFEKYGVHFSETSVAKTEYSALFTSDVRNKIISELNKYSIPLKYLLMTQDSYVEEYSYDNCGNRIQIKSNAGIINFTYDKMNRPVFVSGEKNYSMKYDAEGRLIQESSKDIYKTYKYDFTGKMREAQQIDLINGKSSVQYYEYDALGRKVKLTSDSGKSVYYIYDGISQQVLASLVFDEIDKEYVNVSNLKLLSENQNETDTSEILYRYQNSEIYGTYKEVNSREQKNTSKTVYSKTETLPAVFSDSRYYVYNQGQLQYQFTSSDRLSVCVDAASSVRSYISKNTGLSNTIAYSPSGEAFVKTADKTKTAFSKNNDIASLDVSKLYKGMDYDSLSNTYNNYQRNLNPDYSTFTSLDPLMDGNNWYSYCNNDGVNFVDLNGCKAHPLVLMNTMSKYTTNRYGHDLYLANTHLKLSANGCFLTLVCGVINYFYDSTLEISEINAVSEYFTTGEKKNEEAGLLKPSFLEDLNIKEERFPRDSYKNKEYPYEDQVKAVLDVARLSDVDYVCGLKLTIDYTSSNKTKNTSDHFVGTDGTRKVFEDGKTYVKIIPTSDNDKKTKYGRTNWKECDGDYYAPIDSIQDVRVYSKMSCESK